MIAATASAASSASGARAGGFSFDPASTLGWSAPMMLMIPLLGFLFIVSGIRGRRATANFTIFALLVALADVLLVGWARYKSDQPYRVAYQWINVAVSFSGATQFQAFGVDISFRADHLALAGMAALLVMALAVVAWNRVGGRGEAGPARFHAALLLGVVGGVGVLVSGDLAALTAWWGLAGVATYLLLAHRYGTEATGRASRLGLALPFVGDVALLCAVAVLYSRFGALDIEKLSPVTVLKGTYDAGPKTLGVAAVLFTIAIFVRSGLFPFTRWHLGTLDAPPAAVAFVQGLWPLLGAVLLYRVLPVFYFGAPQPWRVLAYSAAAAAVAGGLLSLAGNDLRRSVVWAGSAVSALVLLALGQPGAAGPSLSAALAICLARPATVLCSWALASTMRSGDLADMGGALRRMRMTSLSMLVACLALAVAIAPKAAARSAWPSVWFLAMAMVLAGFALTRGYVLAAHGELRRRRAFEPTRVREVGTGMWWATWLLAAGGLVVAVAGFFTPWVAFLAGGRQPSASVQTDVLWLGIGLAGPALAFAVGLAARPLALRLPARAGAAVAGVVAVSGLLYGRFLREPGLRLLEAVEGGGFRRGEGALGASLHRITAWGSRGVAPATAIGLVVVLVVVVAVVAGVLAPGVYR
jgi:NADH:ubiquinone oxidoreductase subunit 5 (subunit L)/multisubunit Na+/H+ antiporter MnhA subunit